MTLMAVLTACSDSEVDSTDELGVEAEGYELVYVETTRVEAAPQVVERRKTVVPAMDEPIPAVVDTLVTTDQPIVFDDKGEYTVQIGVYDAPQAAQVVGELSREGYPSYAVPGPDTTSGVRVRIGYFKSKEDAQRFGAIFKADRGGEFWVDRRANE